MGFIRTPAFALIVASLGIAALLGGSLGIVAAKSRPFPLLVGENYSGPLLGDVQPASFIECVPPASWRALYTWDRVNKEWRHYFNTTKGVPAYVNGAEVGGIILIKKGEGVAIIMDAAVQNPYLKDSEGDSCP